MDVKSAFCQTPLPPGYTSTYVRFPKSTRENIMGLLYQLLCSLYGLRDAPRLWHLFWTNILRKLGFVQSRVDPCLWRRDVNTPAEISLLFWVDDSITATRSQAVFESFYVEISKQIDLTRSAVNSQFTFVGISVEYNRAKKTVFFTRPHFPSPFYNGSAYQMRTQRY